MEAKLLKIVDVEVFDEDNERIKNYFQKLKQYKVENLKKETAKIRETVISLDQKTQESAFSNYQAFINSSKSSRLVLQRWNEISHKIDSLTHNVPNFTKDCDKFFKLSYDLESFSVSLDSTEKKNVEILNILELPKLMEISIQREKYDNALELASFVQKLNAKLPNAVLIEVFILFLSA